MLTMAVVDMGRSRRWGVRASLHEDIEHWVSLQGRARNYKQALHMDATAEREKRIEPVASLG